MLKRVLKSVHILATVLMLGLAATANPAHAQTGPALDVEGLKTMLTGLGYEPTDFSSGLLIKREYQGLTLNIGFYLSPDKNEIGLDANLGKADPTKITAQQYFDLLGASRDYDPTFFSVNKESKALFLQRTVDNHGLTPALLRKYIDSFCENVISTEKLWSITE